MGWKEMAEPTPKFAVLHDGIAVGAVAIFAGNAGNPIFGKFNAVVVAGWLLGEPGDIHSVRNVGI